MRYRIYSLLVDFVNYTFIICCPPSLDHEINVRVIYTVFRWELFDGEMNNAFCVNKSCAFRQFRESNYCVLLGVSTSFCTTCPTVRGLADRITITVTSFLRSTRFVVYRVIRPTVVHSDLKFFFMLHPYILTSDDVY